MGVSSQVQKNRNIYGWSRLQAMPQGGNTGVPSGRRGGKKWFLPPASRHAEYAAACRNITRHCPDYTTHTPARPNTLTIRAKIKMIFCAGHLPFSCVHTPDQLLAL